jgi:molybdenum cofactor cytidylyltransferase
MIAAIVPASGKSARMGQPKMLLPIGGVPLVAHVVKALLGGGCEVAIVVAPERANPASKAVEEIAGSNGAHVLVPETPTGDMRGSFEAGLARLESIVSRPPRAVFLAPGDSPAIHPELVAALVASLDEHACGLVVPVFAGRRGHPLLMRWAEAEAVRSLPPGFGLNALGKRPGASTHELSVDDPGVLLDIDTPDDYRRWAAHFPGTESDAGS